MKRKLPQQKNQVTQVKKVVEMKHVSMTPRRVASRLEGVVKNRGTMKQKKKKMEKPKPEF